MHRPLPAGPVGGRFVPRGRFRPGGRPGCGVVGRLSGL